MKRTDIVIGLVVIVTIAGLYYFYTSKNKQETPVLKDDEVLSIEDKLEDEFKIELPDDAEKSNLKSTDGSNGSGLVSSTKAENGGVEITILADLEDGVYDAYLTKGTEGTSDFVETMLGKMRIAKGGYLLDLTTKDDYSTYKKIIIKSGDKKVLEGDLKLPQ